MLESNTSNWDPANNSLLINVNRQISRSDINDADHNKPNTPHKNKQCSSSTDTSKSSSPRFHYQSTLHKRQQSWVDPLEPRIQDTFYHKNLDTLRPRYSLLLKHGSVDAMFINPNPTDNASQTKTDITMHNRATSDLSERSRTPSWEIEDEKLQQNQNKFGTFKGVIARCLLNIFGVIMFLRMGWMVGQSGIFLSIVIILLCSAVTFITTLSMSAIATNGRIEGGGLYYMISRSLGASFGGTVGLLFGVGNAIATSMYLIGFAEVIFEVVGPVFSQNKLTDIRIWSNLALLFETIVALLGGMKLVMRSSMVLLIFIVSVISLIFVGGLYRTDESEGIIGLEGFMNGNFNTNMKSNFSVFEGVKYDFFKVLAIFFPASTGIMAGANISSQLKNPSVNIPKGTLSAIGITTTCYVALVIMLGGIVLRPDLLETPLILKMISVVPELFLGGVFAASLSAAMTSLTSAPSILKAVVDDNIVPILTSICGASGPNTNNDKQMMIISVIIAFCCNLLGSLNMVAPLITDFYLIAYCIINLSCFLSSMSKSPGWRPSFLYYNKYLALCGTILCIIFMILSDWMYAMLALFIAFVLFQYINYIDPDVDWGKVQESRLYYDAFKSVLRLDKGRMSSYNKAGLHVKHWRPGFLVLCGDPLHRPHLIHFANTLSKSHSPTFFATIRTDIALYRTNVNKFHEQNYGNYLPRQLLNSNKKGFFDSVFAESFRAGVTMLMQCVGLGSLRPNTLVLGYKHNWTLNVKESYEYIEVIRDALEMGYAIMLLRNFSYIDWTKVVKNDSNNDNGALNMDGDEKGIDIELEESTHQTTSLVERIKDTFRWNDASKSQFDLASDDMNSMQVLNHKVDSQYIEVWWLIDDGGLTVLLPYIMKLHSFWNTCKLRLNIIADSNALSQEYLNVYHLMNQFRLPYETKLIEVDSHNELPSKQTMDRFHQLTGHQLDFDKDLVRPKVIQKWLKVAELVHQHSSASQVIVLTLPLPTRFYKYDESDAVDDNDGQDRKYMNGKVYFAILEMLTENLPPVILIRGNGQSALTFYSE
eukprot:20339_1